MTITLVKWKLRQLMADRQVSNIELADAVKVHANTISRWKTANEMPKISGHEIDLICRALNCTTAQLLGMESDNASS